TILGVLCASLIGVYAWNARSGCWELAGGPPANSYYNLLAQGLRAGQLHIRRQAPPGLSELADPYDPEANVAYLMSDGQPLYDISYYKGKLHLYFGVMPAVALFWPWHELTGRYFLHKDAVVILCAVGFLAGAGLFW